MPSPIQRGTAAAGTLTGTTLASGVTASSLTSFGSSPTLIGNPVAPTQASSDNSTRLATTAYVTTGIANAIAGVNPAVAVQAATTAAGDTSGFTYSNGVSGIGATLTGPTANVAVTVDGYTFTALGQRLLVKNDTQSPSGAFNGVYYVTTLQAPAIKPILTRALDYDMPSDINNTGAIPVVNGTVNTNTSWLLTSSVATVGTDPLTYVQFSINPSTILYSGGPLGTPSSGTATNLGGTAASLTAGNATKWTTGRTVSITGDVTYTSGSLDGSGNVTGAGTVANVPAAATHGTDLTAVPTDTGGWNTYVVTGSNYTNATNGFTDIVVTGTLSNSTLYEFEFVGQAQCSGSGGLAFAFHGAGTGTAATGSVAAQYGTTPMGTTGPDGSWGTVGTGTTKNATFAHGFATTTSTGMATLSIQGKSITNTQTTTVFIGSVLRVRRAS
jgi:hypothetical protein